MRALGAVSSRGFRRVLYRRLTATQRRMGRLRRGRHSAARSLLKGLSEGGSMTRSARAAILAALIGAATGCDVDDENPGRPKNASSDACAEPLRIAPTTTRRLDKNQYEATLRTLFGDSVIDAIASSLRAHPNDRTGPEFTSMAMNVSSNHVEAYFSIAERLSMYLAADPARLGALSSCLGAPEIEDACIVNFVRDFGRRVFRRPLREEESKQLLAVHAQGKAISPEDGVRFVLFSMLQSPAFVYRLETSDKLAPCTNDQGTFLLNGYELATRLSYLVWGTTPDDALLAAAADGSLETDDGLRREVERLYGHPRAKENVQRFFAEWLGADRVSAISEPESALDGISPTELVTGAAEELRRFIAFHLDHGGKYADLMTSDRIFPPNESVARAYGITNGTPDPNTLTDPNRRGLLMRAAVLIGGARETNPARRGAFVLRTILCEQIPSPDPATLPPKALDVPPFSPNETARQRWTQKTSAPACAGCHQKVNPFGFVLESFDAIGRRRDKEIVFDPATGAAVNELPIDTAVDTSVDDSPQRHIPDARALAETLAGSPKAQQCLTRQWLRFANGRLDAPEDGRVISALTETEGREGVMAAFKNLALTPEFRMRRMVQ
jgi:hypothetical protein